MMWPCKVTGDRLQATAREGRVHSLLPDPFNFNLLESVKRFWLWPVACRP